MDKQKVYIVYKQPNGEYSEQISIENIPSVNTVEIQTSNQTPIFLEKEFTITLPSAYFDRRLFFPFMNNWYKIHGGIMQRRKNIEKSLRERKRHKKTN